MTVYSQLGCMQAKLVAQAEALRNAKAKEEQEKAAVQAADKLLLAEETAAKAVQRAKAKQQVSRCLWLPCNLWFAHALVPSLLCSSWLLAVS